MNLYQLYLVPLLILIVIDRAAEITGRISGRLIAWVLRWT